LGALDGRAVSTLIVPGTFAAGQTYQGLLYFERLVGRDSTSYPGVTGQAGYYKRTSFTVQTTAIATQAGVKLYGVSKTRRFQQTGVSAPALQATKAYNIEAFVDAARTGAVMSASVVLPGGVSKSLDVQDDNKTFQLDDDAAVQSALDIPYPNGNYTFKLSTPSSNTNAPVLNLSGDAYPDAPHITAPAASPDANSDFTVTWEAFGNGTAADFIQLHIEDTSGNKVFETPNFAKAGALDGTALNATVPGGTLLPNKTYSARVVFQKNLVLDTSSYPGALGVASYVTRTTFQLIPTSTHGTAPSLEALSWSGTDGFKLSIQGRRLARSVSRSRPI